MRGAESAFDVYDKAPTLEQQAWIRDHYDRLRVYSPYFDTRTTWYPDGLVYDDSYAIYTNSAIATQHPEWILRGPSGQPLYIPYGTKPYTQYAGDITNAAFRSWWLTGAQTKLNGGSYKGLFVDDVNYYMRVVDATGATVEVHSSAGVLTETLWQRYMADYMTQISAAFPAEEIAHNPIWYSPLTADVERGMAQADLIEIERGVVDSGLTGGTGKYALQTMMAYVDRRHAQGAGVMLDATSATTVAQLEYNLAFYFLVTDGSDYVGSRYKMTPDDWWTGYDTDLGAPLGARFRRADGVFERDFERGRVYVNEPGAPSVTINGRLLGPASGIVEVN